MPNHIEGSEYNPDVHVQFTVKELLARIDGKIDLITALVHEKADKVDLTRLDIRVGTVERTTTEKKEFELVEARVIQLEKVSATNEAVEANKQSIERYEVRMRWVIIGTIVSIGGVAIAMVDVFTKVFK